MPSPRELVGTVDSSGRFPHNENRQFFEKKRVPREQADWGKAVENVLGSCRWVVQPCVCVVGERRRTSARRHAGIRWVRRQPWLVISDSPVVGLCAGRSCIRDCRGCDTKVSAPFTAIVTPAAAFSQRETDKLGGQLWKTALTHRGTSQIGEHVCRRRMWRRRPPNPWAFSTDRTASCDASRHGFPACGGSPQNHRRSPDRVRSVPG